MSPLTKLFVVLHVVLSLLLTAGLIVFVNRTDNFSITTKNLEAKVAAEQSRASMAEADAQATKTSADHAVEMVNAQIKDVQSKLADAQTQIADRDARLAKDASDAALAQANAAKISDALKASEDQKTKQSDALASARTDNDNLVKKNSDLNLAVSDLTNRLDVANRERTNFSEQLAQAKSENENLSKLNRDLGGRPDQTGGTQANLGAVAINGVVRDVRPINGIPYATISVGAEDNVIKGMQFNVIDRANGVFLGQLTVDSVEPNQATGHLDGPKINDVRPGTEVRTQL